MFWPPKGDVHPCLMWKLCKTQPSLHINWWESNNKTNLEIASNLSPLSLFPPSHQFWSTPMFFILLSLVHKLHFYSLKLFPVIASALWISCSKPEWLLDSTDTLYRALLPFISGWQTVEGYFFLFLWLHSLFVVFAMDPKGQGRIGMISLTKNR